MNLDGWREYQVRDGERALEPILLRFGHLRVAGSDPELLRRVWMSPNNERVRAGNREAFNLVPGETVWLPPRTPPLDALVREYRCSGSEAALQAVCDQLKTEHSAASLEPLYVAPEFFTDTYLFGLFENCEFARRFPNGAASAHGFSATDVLTYWVRRRENSAHDVAPAADGADTHNALTVGEPAFKVSLKLQSTEPFTPLREGSTQLRNEKVRFEIKLEKKTQADAHRTIIEIYAGEGAPYFREEITEGELLQPGTHNWAWDGFTASDDTGVLDTEKLRGMVTMHVRVEPTQGRAGFGWLMLKNQPEKAKFLDLRISIAEKRVSAKMRVHYQQLGENAGMWIAATLLMLLAIGLAFLVITALTWLVAWIIEAVKQGKLDADIPYSSDLWLAMGIVAAILLVAAIITLIVVSQKTKLSEAEFNQCKGWLSQGIDQLWTRQGAQAITIDGQQYEVVTRATEDSDNGLPMVIMKPLFKGQRGVNLAMVVSWLPVIVPYDPSEGVTHFRETGAHEAGHSVLARDRDEDYSIRHKGTTGGATDQNVLPSAPVYPEAPAEVDLMEYLNYPTYVDTAGKTVQYLPTGTHERTIAVEEDVQRFFRIAAVKWVQYASSDDSPDPRESGGSTAT